MSLMQVSVSSAEEQKVKEPQVQVCSSSREYITTLEYLREQKDFAVNEKDARRYADSVSTACSGAGKRFIKITQILAKAGGLPQDILVNAEQLSLLGDAQADAFAEVFQKAYSEDSLDLDFDTSVRLARQLSAEFDGSVPSARSDFNQVLNYCLSEKGLDLPRLQCGELAVRVARQGQIYRIALAPVFFKSLDFLRDAKGPHLAITNALKIAEELVSYGPQSIDNFSQAYRYASSKAGLELPSDQSLEFARKLASRSVVKSVK